MAGSWLDALLGKIRNAGAELPLSGGLNFASGLKATLNRATGVVDVTQTNPPQVPATQTGWDPAAGDSDVLETMAAGHDPGFYLIGINATVTGTITGGSMVGAFTWGVDGAGASGTGSAGHTDSRTYRSTSLPVYSDGSAALTAQLTSTVTGSGLTAVVRAFALRVSG